MSIEINYLLFFIITFVTGNVGNIMGIKLTFRKELVTIGPLLMYRFLFTFDSISLIVLSNFFFKKLFGLDFTLISNFTCTVFYYITIELSSVTAMIHVYITFERYLALKYPVESNFLRKKSVQFITLFVVIVLCLFIYLPVFFNHEIKTVQKEVNGTLFNKTLCYFKDSNAKKAILISVFLNKTIIPFSLLVVFSFLLVYKIIISRSRVFLRFSRRDMTVFRKDIQLSIVTIVSNFLFIFLNLPVILVVFFLKYSTYWFYLAYCLCFVSFAYYFYIFLFSLSFFREQFFNLFKCKSQQTFNDSSDVILGNNTRNSLDNTGL